MTKKIQILLLLTTICTTTAKADVNATDIRYESPATPTTTSTNKGPTTLWDTDNTRTIILGDTIETKGPERYYEFGETISEIALTHPGIIEVTVTKDNKAIVVQAKKEGTTLLLTKTATGKGIHILIEVAQKNNAKKMKSRFSDIQKVMVSPK